MLIRISVAAKQQLLATLQADSFPSGYYIRIGRKGTACAGSFLLGLDMPTEQDEIHEVDGVQFLIDKRHLMYIANCELDYQLTEEGLGFTIR